MTSHQFKQRIFLENLSLIRSVCLIWIFLKYIFHGSFIKFYEIPLTSYGVYLLLYFLLIVEYEWTLCFTNMYLLQGFVLFSLAYWYHSFSCSWLNWIPLILCSKGISIYRSKIDFTFIGKQELIWIKYFLWVKENTYMHVEENNRCYVLIGLYCPSRFPLFLFMGFFFFPLYINSSLYCIVLN